MRLALLILWLVAPDLRALQLYERMQFQPADPKDDAARRVVEVLLKKEHWVGAYSSLAEKFGQFPEGLVVTVDFDLPGEELAQGGSRRTKGIVSFNLEKLAEAWRTKWTGQWQYDVGDEAFTNDIGGTALVFAVQPTKVLAFGKGTYSHTRYTPR